MRKFLKLLSELMQVVGPRPFPGQAIGSWRASGRPELGAKPRS